MKSYYETGVLRRETFYKNDYEDGVEKRYTNKGKLRYETSYKEGEKEGVKKWYDENGRLETTIVFKNDGAISGVYHAGNGKEVPLTGMQILIKIMEK